MGRMSAVVGGRVSAKKLPTCAPTNASMALDSQTLFFTKMVYPIRTTTKLAAPKAIGSSNDRGKWLTANMSEVTKVSTKAANAVDPKITTLNDMTIFLRRSQTRPRVNT